MCKQLLGWLIGLYSHNCKISHSLITLDDLYVSEETGDLIIDTTQVILAPLFKNDDRNFACCEENKIVNFGLILMQMLTNQPI